MSERGRVHWRFSMRTPSGDGAARWGGITDGTPPDRLTIQKRVTVASSRSRAPFRLGVAAPPAERRLVADIRGSRLPQNRVIFLTNVVKKSDISIRRSYK
jgi:hypothetical protein